MSLRPAGEATSVAIVLPDGRSWTITIVGQRSEIAEHLEESPGLAPQRDALFAKAYRAARKLAVSETGLELSLLPEAPPFTIDQAEDEAFWPKQVASGA